MKRYAVAAVLALLLAAPVSGAFAAPRHFGHWRGPNEQAVRHMIAAVERQMDRAEDRHLAQVASFERLIERMLAFGRTRAAARLQRQLDRLNDWHLASMERMQASLDALNDLLLQITGTSEDPPEPDDDPPTGDEPPPPPPDPGPIYD
jgi:hypothetical protein